MDDCKIILHRAALEEGLFWNKSGWNYRMNLKDKGISICDVKNIHWKKNELTLDFTVCDTAPTIKCAHDIFDKTKNVKSSTLIEGATSLAHYVV